MSEDIKGRLRDLRDRAYRIVEAARQDDEVPESKVKQYEKGLTLIELGWDTVDNHPRPQEAAPYDLEARLDEWEEQFDEQEERLGIQ